MRFGLTRWRPHGVSRWDPFEEMGRTQERLNQLFEDVLPGQWWGGTTISPLVDIKEEDNKIIVTTDVPGVDKKDVDIDIRDDILEISAKFGEERETEEEGYVRRERTFNRFSRAVRLPATVTEEGAKAKLEDGVLTIELPKVAIEEKKKVMIE
ncbi:MAG: Hsp20/alpha crystallin family protein [Methanosarcinaceae archaeon]|nr:Hsp20/alpha crystallin family protein [Methanosarcinaceae archaeon]